MRIDKSHFRGCLLGGATGDAKGYDVREGGKDLISDNTQMSVFTVDGMIWADERAKRKGVYAYIPCLFYSYQKWYYTQTGNLADKDYGFILGGEVMQRDELFARRGKGVTSLNALGASIKNSYGSLKSRINNSKACGCVMRVSPIGLYFANDADRAFSIGCESAALTHGHTEAIHSAGYMAALISYLAQGATLPDATEAALGTLAASGDGDTVCADLIRKAARLSKEKISTRKAIESIGEGYRAPEAIAIATYLALVFGEDFASATNAATDFNGNNDSIAPICGNIIGMIAGCLEIPPKWVLDLELADLIIHGADLLFDSVREHSV
ncbi:MAG: ADP-ribosylglycohydrolase family protein [Clostridiales Family XIII bacterium]|jgi:ADP-ribosylglycohydrolase|nr:ADP-ribosylglycohydrolase family protein [Clostridiales Family XIII bacterium]